MSYPVFMVPAGDVLPILFGSYDKDDGSSITLTGLAATDIEIYKDGSVTQRASDAGYTLLDTDGIDFDGITGIHGFSIDTGDNTDAGFYTVGAWFTVVVSAVTIDSVAVSFIAAQFRLMAAESVAAKPKVDVDAWLGTAAATPTTNGVPEVDVTHWLGTAAATPTVAGVPEVDVTHVAGTAQTAGDLKASLNTIDDFLDTEIAAIKAVTDLLPDAGALSSLATAAALDTVDNFLDTEIAAIKAKTDSLTFTVANQVDSNVLAISGDTTAADRLEALMDGVIVAQVNDAAASTTVFIADGFTEATNDHFNGRLITFLTGALAGQQTNITDYVGATQTLTVTALTEAPAENDFFVIH